MSVNPDDLPGALNRESLAIAEFRDYPRGDSESLLKKRTLRDPFHEGNPWT